jgi:anti-repressor protein
MSLARFEFDDQEIRFVGEKPVANDVAKALGYADPQSTISKKVFPQNKGVVTLATPGGIQSVKVLEESGIYQLIFSSKLESAQKFQQWVFSEVLPSIRKTGQYAVEPKLPQNYLEALKALVQSEEEKLLLQSQNQSLLAQVKENEPKVALADAIAFSETSVDFNTYAKLINTGRNRLLQRLRDCNVLMKNTTLPYQKYIDAGYFEVSQEVIPNGKLVPFALVTGKGQIWLKQRLDSFENVTKKAIMGIALGVMDMSGF